MTYHPSAPPSSSYTYTTSDIENGRIPVLSQEEIRQAELAQRQQAEPEVYIPSAPPAQYENPPIVFATTSVATPTAPVYNPSASVPVNAYSATAPTETSTQQQQQPPKHLSASAPVVITGVPVKATVVGGTSTIPSQSPPAGGGATEGQQSVLPSVTIYSRRPAKIPVCPYCMATNVKTKTRTSPDWITVLMVIALLLLFWPLFWLPLCMARCKRTEHYCSHCNRELDQIEPLSDCCVTTKH